MHYVYILLCKDKSLYTGYTDDYVRRFAAHKSGRGARYTRAKGAVKIVYTELCATKNEALKREAEIKSWKRADKLKLIKSKKSLGKII